MKILLSATLTIVSIFALSGCGGGGLDAPESNELKGGELIVDFPASAIKASLISKGLIDDNTTVYGYRAYKVPYATTDEHGESVSASGLFVIPTEVPDAVKQIGFSMVSDDHGTIFTNNEAPSVLADSNGMPQGSSVILTSLAAFATLQPDYIGFGDSTGHYHPFILKKSLANATVDFIQAVKVFAVNNDINLNNQLFITGYSEGGYAALATLQKIEDEGTGLTVAMAAPMAGPYALKTMSDYVLSQPELSVPSFMANIGYAYAQTYGEDITSIINEPYASKLPELLDGSKTRVEIDSELTQSTTGSEGLFASEFVSDYSQTDSNWFKLAVIDNSLKSWAPTTAVRFVHCEGDTVIPYGISELTVGTMKAMGAPDVELVPVEATLGLGSTGHGECGTYAYKLAAGMFVQVRQMTMGY